MPKSARVETLDVPPRVMTLTIDATTVATVFDTRNGNMTNMTILGRSIILVRGDAGNPSTIGEMTVTTGIGSGTC